MLAEALNDTETRAFLKRRPVAVLPVGALESHGNHLPAGTDNILAAKLCDALEDAASVPLWRLPLLPYGQVWSLEHAPGSVGIGGETLVSLICEIGLACGAKGLSSLAVVNAHLGNAPYIRAAQRALKEQGLTVANFFYPGSAGEIIALRETPEAHAAYMHACEIETSYMLHLAPEAVRMDEAISNYPVFPADFSLVPYRWTEFSDSPVMGDATAATADKGAAILGPVVARMAAAVAALHAAQD